MGKQQFSSFFVGPLLELMVERMARRAEEANKMGKIEGGEEWRNGTGTELEGEPVTD
jgi:hypothetical protein